MSADAIQPGVYFRAGERPPPAYRLVLLDAPAGAAPDAVRDAVGEILGMLGGLPRGHVRDLPAVAAAERKRSARQFAGLTALVGYGARLFGAHRPPLTRAERPDYLAPLAGFPGLPWADETAGNRGESDIAIQLTAEHQAAVNVAAVEIAKLVADRRLPLAIVATFDGFGRADRRGWLDFHDGVSNLESGQRLEALAAPPDPAWMAGGTYMAFLRLHVDLAAWRGLSRREQELIVGRDKPSGSALRAVDRSGSEPQPVPGGDFVDPPETTDPLLEASHVHRANQSRASPHAPAAHRIFRQGYDFLETIDAGGPRLGLNFVSFQRDLASLQHLLHLPGWLGDVNFGGPAPDLRFVTLAAGGVYAVPPRAEPYPGAALF